MDCVHFLYVPGNEGGGEGMCYSFYLWLNANNVTNKLTSDDGESCDYDVF